MATMLLFTDAQLRERLSDRRVRRIYDDNRDGSADANPILRLRRDASSKVLSYIVPIGLFAALGPLFNPETGEVVNEDAIGQIDPELVRMALDVATAMAAQRHPTIMQMDWRALMEAADAELTEVRMGKRTLIFPRPHGSNHGGAIFSGDKSTATAPTQRFWDDMGDFT